MGVIQLLKIKKNKKIKELFDWVAQSLQIA
jgi:hypothetical protein